MTGPNKVAVLSLGLTKGGQRQGALESAALGVEGPLRLLWKWEKTCKALRPYSLRRGGATHWFRHGSLDKLMLQGRWAVPKTAKVYINEGLAILAEIDVPVSLLKPYLSNYRAAIR